MYVYLYPHLQEVKEAEDALAQAQRRLVRGHERLKVAQRLNTIVQEAFGTDSTAEEGAPDPTAPYLQVCVYVCMYVYIYIVQEAFGTDSTAEEGAPDPTAPYLQVCVYVCMYVCMCIYT